MRVRWAGVLSAGFAVVALSGCLAVSGPTTLLEEASASDVNASGLIAGTRQVGPGGQTEAYVHDTETGTTTMLGTLGGWSSSASAVNDAGTVVGTAGGRAFVWDAEGGMRSIGTLPGYDCDDEPCEGTSTATDINEDGVIVGASTYYDSGFPVGAPFVYDAVNGLRELPVAAGPDGEASAINDAGIVVGWKEVYGPGSRAFAYDLNTGVETDLGTLGGEQATASDVNEAGLIVGYSQLAGAPSCVGFADWCQDTHAFVYDLATGTMTDLGSLAGATRSGAYAINDAGVVVGRSTTSPPQGCIGCLDRTSATVWEVGTAGRYEIVAGDGETDVVVTAINADGLVVGSTWDRAEQRSTAFTATAQVVAQP
jgi:probable HAF family extracellular repeat protein